MDGENDRECCPQAVTFLFTLLLTAFGGILPVPICVCLFFILVIWPCAHVSFRCYWYCRSPTACSRRKDTITERLCSECRPMEDPLLKMFTMPIRTCVIPMWTPQKGTLLVRKVEERWHPGPRLTFSCWIEVAAHLLKR